MLAIFFSRPLSLSLSLTLCKASTVGDQEELELIGERRERRERRKREEGQLKEKLHRWPAAQRDSQEMGMAELKGFERIYVSDSKHHYFEGSI